MKEKKEKIIKKLSSKTKKIIILSCFCLLLLVTGGVNIYLNNLATQDANAKAQTTSNFFDNYRTDRTSTRNQEILFLEAILANEYTSEQAFANAEAELFRLVSSMDSILLCEKLLEAKGFDDVVVSASATTMTVIVKTEGLTKAEVAQIVDVVVNNSAYGYDNIKIMEV